ncbi:hypothetical protein NP233_g10194 [Leucocoprinus birnbaumii]|uniref:Protein kinase domain-containing protein n=1 Tax=Leucocoprinus birnbaumii TaxID=56174 RepID=A0AAD5VPP5_9AGAR|nr:hypothetical protein NP233_g10194 [Leucocoprinus birnbaumii]
MPLPSRVTRLAHLVELPGEPHEPERKLYNCFKHYIVPGNTPEPSMLRVKQLRVPTLYPDQRCISQLQNHLGNKWRLAQEHTFIASTHFCKALEHAVGIPSATPYPMVLVMKEYEGNIVECIDRSRPSLQRRIQWLLQAATALQFLHRIGIIHGNLHTGNILITHEGNAVVADAMIYTTVIKYLVPDIIAEKLALPSSLPFKTAQAVRDKGTRWADPTKYDDLFAFAVTCWAVFSGKEPFPMYKEAFRTVLRISNREHKSLKRVPAQEVPPSEWPSLRDLMLALEATQM